MTRTAAHEGGCSGVDAVLQADQQVMDLPPACGSAQQVRQALVVECDGWLQEPVPGCLARAKNRLGLCSDFPLRGCSHNYRPDIFWPHCE